VLPLTDVALVSLPPVKVVAFVSLELHVALARRLSASLHAVSLVYKVRVSRYVPVPHTSQDVDPSMLEVPGGQAMQDKRPSPRYSGLFVPAGHGSHSPEVDDL
jgi:hypothetical protein